MKENIKKELLVVLLVTLLIISLFALTKVKALKLYKWDDISIFEPFSKNNVLLDDKQNFLIKENQPSIEAASAFYPFAAGFVQNTYSEDYYSKDLLKMVSTSESYSNIISGKADIIIATGPSDDQKKMIEESGVNLEFKTLYLEPLAILVNKANSIDNLSIEKVKEIYLGNNLDWNTYQLEKNNGSQTCFESLVKNNIIENNHYEIRTMNGIVDKIASNKKAIGYAFNSYYSKMHYNTNAKIIKVDGKDLRDENYPLLFEVYLIYRADNTNKNIPEIVNWINTNEGQDFIKRIK